MLVPHVVLGARRALLAATSVLLAAGCRSGGDASPRKPKPTEVTTHAGIEFLEVYTNDAGEEAPIVVGIHGRGDSPSGYSGLFHGYSGRVHFVFPRATAPFHQGYSWFEFREGMTDAEFGAAVGSAMDGLHEGLKEITRGRRYVVTGFSQGGILSYALAARHAGELACAIPVAGSLPGPLLPPPKQRAAPTFALHGADDTLIATRWGRATVDAFKREGGEAELREYPGVGHQITQDMRKDLHARLDACLARLGSK